MERILHIKGIEMNSRERNILFIIIWLLLIVDVALALGTNSLRQEIMELKIQVRQLESQQKQSDAR